MDSPTYYKSTNGLPETGRPFVAYNKEIREYEIFKRMKKEVWEKRSDARQHRSPDGEFYSGAHGWIYPVNFDSYCYLDELGLNNNKEGD